MPLSFFTLNICTPIEYVAELNIWFNWTSSFNQPTLNGPCSDGHSQWLFRRHSSTNGTRAVSLNCILFTCIIKLLLKRYLICNCLIKGCQVKEKPKMVTESTQAVYCRSFCLRRDWCWDMQLVFTVYKSFWKIRLESKWNMTFSVVPAESFREQRNIWKGVLFFRTEYSNWKFAFHWLPSHQFDTSFRPSRLFSGKSNWFVQMLNAIPGQYLPVLNFAYHLPKPWTDRFAHANGKQPMWTRSSLLAGTAIICETKCISF